MAILTAQDFSNQIVAQLRVLDPSISAEIGTPERKIIDSVAQSLADNQVDLTGLSNATDIDSKYGANLDTFTSLFGFARQGATTSSGYVVFSRNTPAPAQISIPTGITIQSNTSNNNGQFMQYQTVTGGTIAQDATTSDPVLVQCTASGSIGAAAVNTLTDMVGTPLVNGVTSVTNPAPIPAGQDAESDDVYKARFKNTVFRNLAGTEDQYLALALAGTSVTKANVIGPVSTYQEYIQIPDVDDAGYLNGIQYSAGETLPNGSILGVASTNGIQNQWTTSLSSIPYAQDIYTQPPPTVTNGQTDGTYFYTQGMDYQFNYPPLITGDADREGNVSGTVAPNFTFLNVYNPSSVNTYASGTMTAAPGDIMLSEFSYLSAASRNSIDHNVYNAIDIFTDGSTPTTASAVFLVGINQFTTNFNDVLYVDNFRRDGEPLARPHPGNFFTPLPQSPIVSLPNTITVTSSSGIVTNYYLGYHYWLIHELSDIGGSVRARDGIEWNSTLNADDSSLGTPGSNLNPYAPQLAPYPSGSDADAGSTTIASLVSSQTPIEVDVYAYDSNVTTLQASIEAARPVGQDALIHSSLTRYFKIDVTVIYEPNVNASVTNASIGTSLGAYYTNQSFGSVIILSDLLGLVQQTQGVSNVRWSNDLPSVPDDIRVIETDINGYPLYTPWVDRITAGSSTTRETQRLYIPGATVPVTTNFSSTLSLGTIYTSLPVPALASAIKAGPLILWDTTSGATQTVTTLGASIGATSIPIEPTYLIYPYTTTSTVVQSYFGTDDSFQLQWIDAINSVNWTSGVISLCLPTTANVTTAMTSGSGYPGSGMYHGISVTQDIWQTPDSRHPLLTYTLSYGANGTPYLPSVVNLKVSQSFYTYDSDFYLQDNELAAAPTGMAPNDSVAGAIIRPRSQGTFVRPGIG